MIKPTLTNKEQVLLKKLVSKISKLSDFMQSEGLSAQDVNEFVVRSVLEVNIPQEERQPKLSKDFSSETEEQTNSEASECNGLALELALALEKVMLEKITTGIKVEKILLGYLEKCCIEENNLRNYLKSEEVIQVQKQTMLDFEKFREKIAQTKYRKNRYESNPLFHQQQNSPPISHLEPIRERIHEVKKRSVVEESQKELDYIRSFEKSLTESIRKTRMLRTMLEKQLSSEFSPLSLLRGDQEEGRGEIY